jgi:hypothetical protein
MMMSSMTMMAIQILFDFIFDRVNSALMIRRHRTCVHESRFNGVNAGFLLLLPDVIWRKKPRKTWSF